MNRLFTIITITTIVLLTMVTSGIKAAPGSPADSLVIRFANRTRLVIYAPDKAGIQALSNYDLNKIVREMGMKLDSVPGGQTRISQDGERFLKDTVLVVTKKKNGFSLTINSNGDTVKTQSEQRNNNARDYKQTKNRRRDKNLDFGISVGLDNFIQQSVNPSYNENDYNLRPLGSRYIAFSAGALPTLVQGKRVSLKLYYGVEVAWNNFMFEGNNVIEKTTTNVAFPDVGRDLQKTKLTVCTIGIPIVPRLTFYNSNGRKTGHIGLGGYGNYRLDSYRKIKEADGGKDRRHSDYYLNNFRYGVMAHVGIQSLNFFVKYDLNPLFQPGKGPDVRTITFGVGF